MRLHPGRKKLFAHAESLADGASAISADVARHVCRCERCKDELAGMRETLEFVQNAPALEPSEEMTATIFAAAKAERLRTRHWGRTVRLATALTKGLAFAAGIAVMTTVSFQMALGSQAQPLPAHAVSRPVAVTERTLAEGPSPEEIRQASEDIQVLAKTFNQQSAPPANLAEWRHRRTAMAAGDDLSKALAALERNPGCVRANRLANKSLQKQAGALRSWYEGRTY